MVDPQLTGVDSNRAEGPPSAHRIKLDFATIVAIQRSLDRIETGHGFVTIEVSQFKLIKIVHAESELLEPKPKRLGQQSAKTE
jgi:hypothetical protein